MITKGKSKTAGQIMLIETNRIIPNRNQPRESFDEEELELLSGSIRRNGIIQPLTVRKRGEIFELVAGERRLRAAKKANLRSVPCIIMDVGEKSSAVISLLENIQRSQLNFLEEAKALQTLSQHYSMSREEIASSLGMSTCTVSNYLRVLKLSDEVLRLLTENNMTQRHARALLRLDEKMQSEAAKIICEKKMTVSQTESFIEKLLSQKEEDSRPKFRKIFFKDVRIFINTINHAVETMQSAGIEAHVDRKESDEGYTITVSVPKAKKTIQNSYFSENAISV